MKKLMVGLAFASPWVIGFLVFNLYPVFVSLYYSFTNFDIMQSPEWTGMANYVHLFHDQLFHYAVYNTLYITLIGVPLSIILGIGCALLLTQRVHGIGIFRTLVYVPSIVPPVVVSLLWMFILNPQYGLLNAFLGMLHIAKPGWLASPIFAKPALLMMILWQSGQVMILMLAGLQDIPRSLYEAVRIDGAGFWASFRHVTLPMLSPVIFYNVIMGVIGSFQFFTQAYVATSTTLGAPANSTLFMTVYLYENAFQFMKMGYASAIAWVLLVMTLIVTLIVFRFGNRMVYYGGE